MSSSIAGRLAKEASSLSKRGRVDNVYIQEIKWKGAKSLEIGDGYKILYYGTSNNSNGAVERLHNKISLKK